MNNALAGKSLCDDSNVGGLFFTGSDTGVGKTYVTAGVARLLRRGGRPVEVCKPIATGARSLLGILRSEDTAILAEAADTPHEQVTHWAFEEPVAPSVAARRAKIRMTNKDLARFVNDQRRPGHALLVEGVGGLLCPLNERETVADLAADIGFPLVVVVRRSLGTLNHTLLTLEVARSRGLQIAGIVINAVESHSGLADETNAEELARLIDVPVLAILPYDPDGKTKEVVALAQVNWWELCCSGVLAKNEG